MSGKRPVVRPQLDLFVPFLSDIDLRDQMCGKAGNASRKARQPALEAHPWAAILKSKPTVSPVMVYATPAPGKPDAAPEPSGVDEDAPPAAVAASDPKKGAPTAAAKADAKSKAKSKPAAASKPAAKTKTAKPAKPTTAKPTAAKPSAAKPSPGAKSAAGVSGGATSAF